MRFTTLSSLLLAVFVAVAAASGTAESRTLSCYRALQYDFQDTHRGSQRTALSLTAVPLSMGHGSRHMAVVRMADLTVEDLEKISQSFDVSGLLIVVPSDETSLSLSSFRPVERWMLENSLSIPVYFTHEGEGDSLTEMLLSGSEGLHAVVSNKEAVRAEATKDWNMQSLVGWIRAGESSNTEGEISDSPISGKKTVAIAAHYDSMSIAPTMGNGSLTTGSNVAALLELARIFGTLSKSPRTSLPHGEYELVFVLSAGGPLNYLGTHQWLEGLGGSVLDSLSFVLALESLHPGEREREREREREIDGEREREIDLYLHASRQPKDAYVQKWFDALQTAAAVSDMNMEVVTAKIRPQDEGRRWHHEVWAWKRIPGVTISAMRSPHTYVTDSTLSATSRSVTAPSAARVARNIAVVARAVASVVYSVELQREDLQGNDLSVGVGIDVDVERVESIMKMAGSVATVPHPDLQSDVSPYLSALQTSLSLSVSDLSLHSLPPPSDVHLYGQFFVEMQLFRTKGWEFDVMVSGIIALYCVGLYAMLAGTSKLADAFKNIPVLLKLKKA